MNLFFNLASELRIDPLKGQGKVPYSQEELVQKVMQALVDRYQVSNYFSSSLDPSDGIFNLVASADSWNVSVPPLYFVDRKDIPFTGPSDPTLKDEKKVQEFASQICKQFKLQELSVGIRDEMGLRLYLKALECPENAGRALKFVLLHELGHIHLRHFSRSIAYEAKFRKPLFFIINLLTLGIFRGIALLRQSRNHEKEADAFAYKISKDVARGGIYLFKTARDYRFHSSRHSLVNAIANIFGALTHTSLSSRIHAIEKHLKIHSTG